MFPLFYRGAIVGGEAGLGELWWGWAVAASALIVAFTSPFLGAVADLSGASQALPGVLGRHVPGRRGAHDEAGAGDDRRRLPLLRHRQRRLRKCQRLLQRLPPRHRASSSAWVAPRATATDWGISDRRSACSSCFRSPSSGRFELVWLSVIAFFAVFSIPAFLFLPGGGGAGLGIGQAARRRGSPTSSGSRPRCGGHRNLRRFLFAFFFYIDGVLTLIVMAGVIAQGTFGFDQQQVIILFLIVQFSALAGAFALAKPTDTLGPKKVLTGVIFLWVAAGSIRLLRRGSERVSTGWRSWPDSVWARCSPPAARIMASLIPDGREAELFGFYALCGRSSSVIGPGALRWESPIWPAATSAPASWCSPPSSSSALSCFSGCAIPRPPSLKEVAA